MWLSRIKEELRGKLYLYCGYQSDNVVSYKQEQTWFGEVKMAELNIAELRKICVPENIEITMHAAKRLEQRGILLRDVISCVCKGEIIEQYPDDYPYPSCLILGISVERKYIHVVVGSNLETIWVITAYYPDLNKWEQDFKTRKENQL